MLMFGNVAVTNIHDSGAPVNDRCTHAIAMSLLTHVNDMGTYLIDMSTPKSMTLYHMPRKWTPR